MLNKEEDSYKDYYFKVLFKTGQRINDIPSSKRFISDLLNYIQELEQRLKILESK